MACSPHPSGFASYERSIGWESQLTQNLPTAVQILHPQYKFLYRQFLHKRSHSMAYQSDSKRDP